MSACLGYAQADITPDMPMRMIGFGRTEPAERALAPLRAQVSVWRFGGQYSCLAAIDHIGFGTAHANALREAIGGVIGASAERVMLCFSHTHCAPNDSAEPAYSAEADRRVLAAAREAMAACTPVKTAWANAEADIGVNRRPGARSLDRRVGVCRVTDAQSGELRLILLRITAHNNALKGDNPYISPDFFGAARDMLEARYGCPAMLTQGASGNVAPKYFQSRRTPPDANDPARFVRSERACEDMARALCASVGAVIGSICPKDVNRLSARSQRARLDSRVPTWERALEVAAEAKRETGADGTAWLGETRRLIDAGIREQHDDVEIQYFALNEGCLCGVPNELMCEFALRASDALADEFFYLGGYTNGCTGYFPTEEEFDKGGYEVYWSMLDYFPYYGRVFPLNRESAGELLEAVVRGAHAL